MVSARRTKVLRWPIDPSPQLQSQFVHLEGNLANVHVAPAQDNANVSDARFLPRILGVELPARGHRHSHPRTGLDGDLEPLPDHLGRSQNLGLRHGDHVVDQVPDDGPRVGAQGRLEAVRHAVQNRPGGMVQEPSLPEGPLGVVECLGLGQDDLDARIEQSPEGDAVARRQPASPDGDDDRVEISAVRHLPDLPDEFQGHRPLAGNHQGILAGVDKDRSRFGHDALGLGLAGLVGIFDRDNGGSKVTDGVLLDEGSRVGHDNGGADRCHLGGQRQGLGVVSRAVGHHRQSRFVFVFAFAFVFANDGVLQMVPHGVECPPKLEGSRLLHRLDLEEIVFPVVVLTRGDEGAAGHDRGFVDGAKGPIRGVLDVFKRDAVVLRLRFRLRFQLRFRLRF
mmetsp:Transcript_6242/g.17778  ORF Transcript_6242/g.17778 Transcript_6242/m.17778 type:complete len:394 (-) Transcript_6242:200-1381(-)